MKKITIGIVAIALFSLSCTNGSATSLESGEKGSENTGTITAETPADSQEKLLEYY